MELGELQKQNYINKTQQELLLRKEEHALKMKYEEQIYKAKLLAVYQGIQHAEEKHTTEMAILNKQLS